MTFNCRRCGACCKLVGFILPFLPLQFTALFRPDDKGVCHYLIERDDGLCECSIYESRPDICRVDKMAQDKAGELKITKEQYYQYSEQCCELIRKMREQDIKQ